MKASGVAGVPPPSAAGTDDGPDAAAATRSDSSTLAYERIRHDIVTGELGEGERLTEQGLAARLGLSRTPVRAAIGRLILEGFVERGGGYSTRVARFPEDELEQIFTLRLQLEGYAARRAAQFADAEQVEALQALATRMSTLTGGGEADGPAHEVRADGIGADEANGSGSSSGEELAEMSRLNERFHALVVRAARSPRLAAMLGVAIDMGVVARTYRLYSGAGSRAQPAPPPRDRRRHRGAFARLGGERHALPPARGTGERPVGEARGGAAASPR